MRKAVIIALFVCCSAFARSGTARLDAVAGDNTVFGTFGGTQVSASHSCDRYFQVRGALRYYSFPSWTSDIRPGYFHDFRFGRISAEADLVVNSHSSTMNVCAGFSAAMHLRWFRMRLGYYYRRLSPVGLPGSLTEPCNLMYEFAADCLGRVDRWDLLVSVSNCGLGEMERVYYPTFSVDVGYRPHERIGLCLTLASRRAGMFNIAATHHQSSLSLGVKYIW